MAVWHLTIILYAYNNIMSYFYDVLLITKILIDISTY